MQVNPQDIEQDKRHRMPRTIDENLYIYSIPNIVNQ